MHCDKISRSVLWGEVMFRKARSLSFVFGVVLLLGSCATVGRSVPDNDGAVSTDGVVSTDGAVDLDAGPPADSANLGDGCVAQSDQELCTLHQTACGALSSFDNCGEWREIAECGPCVDGHCESGSCVSWIYSWQTDAWSSCSVSCGGGVQTRSVWCERDDGQSVADSFCPPSKPATNQSCNTQACCTSSCVSHDACGDDGCGTSCGSCASDRTCWTGHCIWEHGNNGTETCNTICAWGSSQCVGTSSHSCSTLGVGGIDCYCW